MARHHLPILMLSLAPLAALAAPKKPSDAPALRFQQFQRSIQVQVEEKREEQIQGIERLLELGAEPAELPDLKFRLAELYYERSRYYFFRSEQAADDGVRAEDPYARERAEKQKRQYVEEQQRWLETALAIFQEIRLSYPEYTRIPEVLFAMGQIYWNVGRPRESIDIYAELIRNHPDSPLVSEAWLTFGEYYFDEGDVPKALRSYEKAAADKRSRVYGFALYKQGWCYYNMADWQSALRKFKATVLYAQLSSELSGENKIALGKEAQKDYVRTYQHVGDADQAKYVLADLLGVDACDTPECKNLLENLADLWRESGYFKRSASLFRQLIRLEPDSEKNAGRQGKIVDLVAKSGSKKKVVQETKQLVAMVKALPPDSQVWEEGALIAENNLRRLAQIWNQEARKTRNDQTLRYALSMYEDYLELFPDAELAYEMRFQLADIYFKLERFEPAATAYEQTVRADPGGKYLVDAANDAILAVEEHIRDLQLPEVQPGKVPVEIHPQKQRLIRVCDMYVERVPDDKSDEKTAVRFKAAKVYYDYNHLDEAMRRFEEIVQAEPRSEQAEFAANLVLDVHNLREDWDALYAAAMRYRGNAALLEGRPQMARDLDKFAQAAKFKVVKTLETDVEGGQADYAQVARGYQEFYEEFPNSPDADKALFNASVAWDRAGQKERASEMRQRLLDEYKDSPLRVDVAYYQAKQLEERTQFVEAARAFLGFARKYPKDDRARDALYNAAVFYAGMGQASTAAKLRLEYLETYGKNKEGQREAADIFWQIASDLDRAGRKAEAAARYADFARMFDDDERKWEAMHREVQLRRELRQRTAADRVERRFTAAYARMRRRPDKPPVSARKWMAEIELEALEPELRSYDRLKLRSLDLGNTKPFQRSVETKAQSRDALIERYTGVVTRYQEASTSVAALRRIAGIWDDFVQSVVSVPCPRGIGEDGCLVVKDALQTQAAPARQAALEAYQVCVDKSIELQMYTRDSKKCVAALEERGVLPEIVELQVPVKEDASFESPASNGPILRLQVEPTPGPVANAEAVP